MAQVLHLGIFPVQGIGKAIDTVFRAQQHIEARVEPGDGALSQLAGEPSCKGWLRPAEAMAKLTGRDALSAFCLQLQKTVRQPWHALLPHHPQGQGSPTARSSTEFDAEFRVLRTAWGH
jgi:hypothetical protein